MAILPMRTLPDPILRQQAKRVNKVTPALKKLVEDMIDTMHDQQGVGLAANQVGSLQKVAVIQLPDWEEPMVLINPEIVRQEGEREVEEGCLSIPGYRGMAKRSEKVRAKAMGLDGKVFRIKGDDLLAQALEHETDHLNGVLYIDRLASRDKFWKIMPAADQEESDSGETEDSSEESPREPEVPASRSADD